MMVEDKMLVVTEDENESESESIYEKDLLSRKVFVDKMIEVTEIIATNRKNVCYALNGAWGVGKSFVLDLFEEYVKNEQSEETASNKYFLFHYNCWEYDYYEEPLVAIVSSMLDEIEKQEKLFSSQAKYLIKSALKIIGKGLLAKGNEFVEEKTGINLEEVAAAVKDANDARIKELEENQKFDSNFNFKKALNAMKETVKSISKEKTLIFVVDELDRCLPEYAIKVLERLHHLFDNVPNVQMIIAVDKKQFEYTVKNIYGNDTDVDKYLAKFINFEMSLDEGYLSGDFDARFDYYLSHFDYLNSNTTNSDINEFKSRIFTGIDMRGKIEIIDKCHLLHTLLNKDESIMDYSFMCVEISFMVFKYWGIDLQVDKPPFNIYSVFKVPEKVNVTGLHYLNKVFNSRNEADYYYHTGANGRTYVTRQNIWGVILSSYRYVTGYTGDGIAYDNYKNMGLEVYGNDFKNLMYTIN